MAASVALVAGVLAMVSRASSTPSGAGAALGALVPRLATDSPQPRDLEPYAGLGTWIDGFDFGPAYQASGVAPPLGPKVIDDLAAAGVETLYLQAWRDDPRSPGGIVDRTLVAELLLRAHRQGIKVVAWFLPYFVDVEADLTRLQQMSDFSVLGHRFDGLALDIEATDTEPDLALRNRRLVDLSQRWRQRAGDDVVGAIVLPPVLTEVVNPSFWPEFPWLEIAPLYDVWLPMSYWSFRLASSGYKDGYTYNEESTRRLRANLGRPDAPVHGIGGIGDETGVEDLDRFVRSLTDTASIGGSVYDWATLGGAGRDALAAAFGNGPGAALPAPP